MSKIEGGVMPVDFVIHVVVNDDGLFLLRHPDYYEERTGVIAHWTDDIAKAKKYPTLPQARSQATKIAKRGGRADVVQIRADVGVVLGDGERQATAMERIERERLAAKLATVQWKLRCAQAEVEAAKKEVRRA